MIDTNMTIDALLKRPLTRVRNVHVASEAGASENETQTNDVFSEKWVALGQEADDQDEAWKRMQFDWYLRSYGYESEQELVDFLKKRSVLLDAGCGLGYKAAWLARLAPHATVVAMDLSEAIFVAGERYGDIPNLVFVKGDIGNTPFRDGAFDLVSCDQVLHHTENPPATVREFARILCDGGVLNTYVYAKKALPRELLDEHFRTAAKALSSEELWELSDQLTRLGRTLSDLKLTIDVPDMPTLGIKGGPQDLQRVLYWNYIKCFWDADFGYEASKSTNFDWYAPSTAFRYSMPEFAAMVTDAGFRSDFTHSEEACHTGRFTK